MKDLAERIANRVLSTLDIGAITYMELKTLVAAIDDELIAHLDREREARRHAQTVNASEP